MGNTRSQLLAEADDMISIVLDGDEPYTTAGLQDLINRLVNEGLTLVAAKLAWKHNERHGSDGHNMVSTSRGVHMDGTTLQGEYDWTTGKTVYYRLVRIDHASGQRHVLIGWRQLQNEAAMNVQAVNDGCERLVRGEA